MSTPQSRAIGKVSAAVRYGLLTPVKKLRCVDCGRRAWEYDHRNYYRPLEVQAVCRSCNIKRGPAKGSPCKVKPRNKRLRDTARAVKWLLEYEITDERIEIASKYFAVHDSTLWRALGKINHQRTTK